MKLLLLVGCLVAGALGGAVFPSAAKASEGARDRASNANVAKNLAAQGKNYGRNSGYYGNDAAHSSATSEEDDYQRTIVRLMKYTVPGQYVFFRGGLAHSWREGCDDNTAGNNCSIPIRLRPVTADDTGAYDTWRVNDTYLDWYGKEEGQEDLDGWQPQGSPGVWTNYPEDHYWLLDMDMDCSRTESGLFEIKGYFSTRDDGKPSGQTGYWEGNINNNLCDGLDSLPFSSTNHVAKCGAVNELKWGEENCTISEFD